jgi:enoyl-CoA hydratase
MGEVSLTVAAGVAVITLRNYARRNALDPAMHAALGEIFTEVNGNAEVGAAVILGENGFFCSGSDTGSWGPAGPPASDPGFERTSSVYQTFLEFGQLAPVTIAAVRGAAIGAGLNLALAADMRVVAADAVLKGGFRDVGIHPGGGFFTLTGRLAGRQTAALLGVIGEPVTGAQAVTLGLAWEALDDAQVEERAMALATKAAEDPTLSRRAIASLRAELGPPGVPWPAAVEIERGVQMWSQQRRQDRAARPTDGN